MHERAWIHDYILPLITAPGAAGLSDDVALLRHGRIPLISMDTLVSGVHFLPGDPLGTVGQKLVRVNVSDIHAKGARPLEAMLSIAWPEALCERDFRALMSGIGQDLKRFGCDLIGGDLVHTPGPLTLTLTLTGDCLGDAPVRRSDGQIGDGIFIHGEIGWGGLGLEAARTGQAPGLAERYRVPDISDITAAGLVAQYGHASLDVSDGLLRDALSLAEASACGIQLALDRVPLACRQTGLSDILRLCCAGDDYRILMAAPAGSDYAGFTRIGTLIAPEGLHLLFQGQPVELPQTLGFEHRGSASTQSDLS